MAVPTGDYEAHGRIDLSPVFGVLTHAGDLRIEQPPANILDRRLAELESKDPSVRIEALTDLSNFPNAEKRIGPVLEKLLHSEEPELRSGTLSTLFSFPATAKRLTDEFVKLLAKSSRPPYERSMAVWLLSNYAPKSKRVETVLLAASRCGVKDVKEAAEYGLQQYRRRAAGK